MRAARPRTLRPAVAAAGVYALAVAVALLVGAALIALAQGDAATAYRTMFRTSLGSAAGLAQTLNKTSPLLLGSVAVVLGMRAGLFNIGVDGQIYLGAIAATGAAFALGAAPRVLALPVVGLAGILGGAALAAVPAVLRAAAGVNEIFVTVMLNFVALLLTEYLATGPWNDPIAGEAISRPIPAGATLPMLAPRTGLHAGIVLAVAAGLLVAWVLDRTVLGYQIRAVGDNPRAARAAGIPLAAMTLVALIASGALGGLAGAIEVSGFHYRLILGLSPGYGVMAILVAVLSRRHVLGAMAAAFGFAVLLVGSDSLQRSIGLPASAVFVFQAVILLVVLLADAVRPGVPRARARRAFWTRRALEVPRS